ncbi:MAG: phosphomannose isomerase type II C-terminal cupin domain [Nanoarchaeota archaeon]|nr:phosphomannose isomerase type II C-terminal cupin domain [Nanoarchaeota archaeon]
MTKSFLFKKKPWGNFKQYTQNEISTVKIITVNPKETLSKQKHKNRDELWVVLDEGLIAELNDRIWQPQKNEEIFISRGAIHRLSSNKIARVLEISFGSFDENDIERIEDKYGRE